jgi:hypothetical protein
MYLSDLSPVNASNGNGPYEKDKANGQAVANDGPPLSFGAETFAKGLGVHAPSELTYNVSGLNYKRLKGKLGIADYIRSCNLATVVAKVYANNMLIYQSPVITNISQVENLDIELPQGTTEIKLVADQNTNGNSCDHFNWAEIRLSGLCQTDVEAPGVPSNLRVGNSGARQNATNNNITLLWDAATDNRDTELSYEVYLNKQYIGVTQATSYTINNVTSGMQEFVVVAKDDHGNKTMAEPLNQMVIGGPLPLQLTNFAVKTQNNNNVVSWETKTELGLNYFILERSHNAGPFIPIANIKANNTEYGNYNFTDQYKTEGANYYRLRITEQSGKQTLSNVIVAYNETKSISFIGPIYPNPIVGQELTLELLAGPGNWTLSLISENGRTVSESEMALQKGKNKVNLPSNLSAGVYFLSVKNGKNSIFRKLIIQ